MPVLAVIPQPSPLWFQHMACVLSFFAATTLLILHTQRQRDPAKRRAVELGVAAVGLLTTLIVNAWWHSPAHFTWQKSLPCMMCDIVGIIAPLAMFTKLRPLRALLHFWGFGLCSQWVLTPGDETSPATIEFWISFILHASILGTAAFDFCACGFRPTWRDWRLAMLCGAAYVAAMIPLNVALRSNYGFVGPTKPPGRTIIDLLGPYPLRIVWIVLLGSLAVLLVKLAGSLIERWWGQPTHSSTTA